MVILVGTGDNDLIWNPGQICLHASISIYPRETYEYNYSASDLRKIVGKTKFSNLIIRSCRRKSLNSDLLKTS